MTSDRLKKKSTFFVSISAYKLNFDQIQDNLKNLTNITKFHIIMLSSLATHCVEVNSFPIKSRILKLCLHEHK